MVDVLAFGLVLLLAVLLSELADRSILSVAVLFLAAGVVLGPAGFGVLAITTDSPVVIRLSEYALFSVLFTDGMKIPLRDLSQRGHLPGRALALGLPVTLVATAAAAHWIVEMPWTESLLLGAVLSPTDPVLVSAIVGQEKVPARLRHLLNVESGLNDGLALPIVMALLATLSRQHVSALELVFEVVAGVALGRAIPWLVLKIETAPIFAIAERYDRLLTLAIGLVTLAVCSIAGANEYLAAFSAGITVATVGPRFRDAFDGFGEALTDLFKLAALLVFGALLTPKIFAGMAWHSALFAVMALAVARPVGLWLALLGARLPWWEFAAAAWFGPKGFASVIYALLVLQSGASLREPMFRLCAVVIAASIILRSSSDMPLGRWLIHKDLEATRDEREHSKIPADTV